MKKDQRGMIIVESVMSLLLFTATLTTFISLFNVFAVYMRVQTALTYTALELSQYTYVYSKLGLDEVRNNLSDKSQRAQELLDGIGAFAGDVSNVTSGSISIDEIKQAAENGQSLSAMIGGAVEDPTSMFKSFIAIALSSGFDTVKASTYTFFAESLVKKYLEFDVSSVDGVSRSADNYLKTMYVENGFTGLDFSKSKFLQAPSDSKIDLVVTYYVKLPISIVPVRIHMMNRAVTSAWMSGSGELYE